MIRAVTWLLRFTSLVFSNNNNEINSFGDICYSIGTLLKIKIDNKTRYSSKAISLFKKISFGYSKICGR